MALRFSKLTRPAIRQLRPGKNSLSTALRSSVSPIATSDMQSA